MPLIETEAIVLRTYKLAEADKIVVFLTRRMGLLRGVAKGARRLRSKYGASLELFTLVQMSCFIKENRELAVVRQTDILRTYFALAGSAEIVASLEHLSELLIGLTPPYEPNEKLFRMVRACLNATADAPENYGAVLLYFEIWLLKLAGFLPDLDACAGCRESFKVSRSQVHLREDHLLCCSHCACGAKQPLLPATHAQLAAAQRSSPEAWARRLQAAPIVARDEMARLTRCWLAHALERQPRKAPYNLSSGLSRRSLPSSFV